MKKISTISIVILLVILFLLGVRNFITQKNFISEAKKTSNPIKSIRYYERALLSYIPLSPYNKKAINGILDRCKEIKEIDQQLYCYETLRSALYQIRSLYQPYEKDIKSLETLIAELKTAHMIQWKYNNFSEKDRERLYNYHIEILKYDGSPSIFWSTISVFSLIAWIGSVFLIILKGFTYPIDKKYLLLGFTSFILFFSLWIIGLYTA